MTQSKTGLWRTGLTTAALSFMAAVVFAGAGWTQTQSDADGPGPYRLTVGDIVDVAIMGEGESWEARIDLDGTLRLPALGRLHAEGLSLDDAEEALRSEIEATGLFVSPRISVAVSEYAPVLVTGTVRAPGLFQFTPTMTVEAAAGLAGGVALTAVDGPAMTLQATQLSGDLRRAETDILGTLVRIARTEAQLEGQDTFEFDSAAHSPLVRVDMDLLSHLLSRERLILTEEKQATEDLQRLRQIELSNVEKQIELLLERRKVQENLIRLQEEERTAAEELDARGLRTRMDMARLDRNDASLQAQMLDIEAALSGARTRLADISTTLTKARIDRRLSLLGESTAGRKALEKLLTERRTVLEKSVILGDPTSLAFADETTVAIEYTLRRRTDGVVETFTAHAKDPIRPGDTLLVTVTTESPTTAAGVSTPAELAVSQ